MTHKNGVTGYVQPNDAGLNSEPRAVGRRIAKMLNAVTDNCNRWIVQGQIEKDCWEFRSSLIEKLRADGWEVTMNANDRFTCKPGKAYWASLREVA